MLNQVILSSHYFPCIAYFAHLVKYPDIIIDIGENFLKQSYRNRCIIYTSNGPLALSIPVIKKNNTPMKDVLIDVKEDWKTKHWRAISSAYNSSPFFEFYCDELKEVLSKEYSSFPDRYTSRACYNYLWLLQLLVKPSRASFREIYFFFISWFTCHRKHLL